MGSEIHAKKNAKKPASTRANPKIGTAGWTIPKELASAFPKDGSHLERYAQSLTAVEINSSFYRPHQAKTYKRWADETPPGFSFSVKMSKEFSHIKKLAIEDDELALWLEPVKHLGEKFGVLLVQLPPKQEFDLEVANSFFKIARDQVPGLIALEPRHISWASREALDLLDFYDVAKVEADPERCPSPRSSKTKPRYARLHGSPQIYKSLYEPDVITKWATEIQHSTPPFWVIFDNTTFGHATANALDLLEQSQTGEAVSASSSSRKLSRRKRGATQNIVKTVTKLMTDPKTAD